MKHISSMVQAVQSMVIGKQNFRKMILILAALVVFVVTYMLILPAITLDKEEAVAQGGIDIAVQEEALDAGKTVLSVDGKDYGATIIAGKDAKLEDSDKFTIKKVDGDKYTEAVDKAFSDEGKVVADAQYYELSLSSTPKEKVKVGISLSDPIKVGDGQKLVVVDFSGDEPKPIDDFDSEKNKSGAITSISFKTEKVSDIGVCVLEDKVIEEESEEPAEEATEEEVGEEPAAEEEAVQEEAAADEEKKDAEADEEKASGVKEDEDKEGAVSEDKKDKEKTDKEADNEASEDKKTDAEAADEDGEQKSESETATETFIGRVGDVNVVVKAPVDAFPENTEMKVEPVANAKVQDAIEATIDGEAKEFKAVDITFTNDGIEVQPAKPIEVTMNSADVAGYKNPVVVHIQDNGKGELIDSAEKKDKNVTFQAEKFSVYAIVPYDGIPQPPRVTFEFEDPNNAGFYFIDKAGNHQTTQIIKDGEVLQDVGLPTIPEGEKFGGWFIYDEDNNPVEAVNFESAIAVAYGAAGAGSTVSASSITIDPDDLADDGTYHVKVKAFFGEVVYLTFYEDAEGNNILNRIQIAKGSDYDISTVEVNAPESELAFGGWAASAGENDDDRDAISPTALTNIQSDRSFYPIFKSGHWLTFYAGATGSGATYSAPVFVIAGGTASGAQPSNPEWKGYAFQYWTETNLYTGENGSYVQPSSAPERLNFNSTLTESKTLYAYWTPANTTYTVVFWKQNVTDSKNTDDSAKTYAFAEQITVNGTTGTTVNASNYSGRYSGFNLNSTKSDSSIVVKADGTSIINIYFDRQLITMKFYKYGNSTTAPGVNSTYYNTTTDTTRVTVYTGLYGQTLAQNNYDWPDGEWMFYTTNGTAGMSYLGQFVFPLTNSGGRVVYDPNNQEMRLYYSGAGNCDIRYYIQDADNLNNYSLADTGKGSGGTFNFSEKFDGFEIYRYRKLNHNTTTVYQDWTTAAVGGTTSTSHTTGWGWSQQTVYEDLEIRYNRKVYKLQYLDSVDNTELSGISSQNIVYGASLSNYKPAASFTPVSQYPGKVWDGKWYKDQACSEEFVWTDTMPNADMVVYAGWEDVYYKVDVDPNGGVLTDSESTFFWMTYGQTVQRYDDVTRDYVEDPNGTFKYESFLRKIYTDAGYDPWDYSGYLRSAKYVNESTNTTSTMTPYSGGGSSVSVSYPYDTTRYKYDKGAYALIGWYEITFEDGHYGDLNYKTGESLYTFGTGVTHDTYIQAKWRKVGDYHVDYKTDVYLMSEDGSISTSDSGIETTNVPTDPNSYADQSQSAIMRSPDTPITVGEGDDAKTYVFQGWYYNGELYKPGDVFTVLSSIAEDKVIGTDPETQQPIIRKTVNIYPVYQAVDSLPVDTTHIYWYSNWKDKDGNQINDLDQSTQLKDESNTKLQPNKAIDILAIDDLVGSSTAFDGYTFKGWARVPVDVDVTADTFNANAYMYLYWDGSKFHIDSENGTVVTEVAADENTPYHDMYAVWEINKYTVTVTKTVIGTDADQHKGFTFAPEFTKYTGGSNFILAGQETTVTDDETGASYTYYTTKTFENVPYGATLKLSENDEENFETTVQYKVTTNSDGSAIANPTVVDSEDEYTYTISGDITIAYTNSRKTQQLKIVKEGDNTEGASIEDATFTLTETDYGTLTSDANGTVTAEDGTEVFTLDNGNTYTLSETAAPQYFNGLSGNVSIVASDTGITATAESDVDEDNVSIDQDDDGVYVLTITNIRKTADVTITKEVDGLDADGNTPFTFTISGVGAEPETKNLVGNEASNDHSVTYESIPYGTSINVTEESNADFSTTYSLNKAEAVPGTSYTFTLNDEKVVNGVAEIVFTNARNNQNVQVLKVDEGTTPLANAKFSLYTEAEYNKGEDGTPEQTDLTSNVQGKIQIGKVNTGTYYLVETTAPDGYNLLDKPVIITVNSHGVSATLGAENIAANIAQLITPETGDPYWQITVHNNPGVELPMTGGPGTTQIYLLGGLLLLVAAAMIYVSRMRRTERRSTE